MIDIGVDLESNPNEICDLLAHASCYRRYPKLQDYLEALEYQDTPETVAEGTRQYEIGKRIYNQMHKVFTGSQIEDMSRVFNQVYF